MNLKPQKMNDVEKFLAEMSEIKYELDVKLTIDGKSAELTADEIEYLTMAIKVQRHIGEYYALQAKENKGQDQHRQGSTDSSGSTRDAGPK